MKNPTTRAQCLTWWVGLILLAGFALPSAHPPQDIIKIQQELVVLHATVENRKGTLMDGLSKEDFQIYEDGILQPIESLSHEDVPVTVGLVIDNSGSMRTRRLEVITAALAFARSSNPKDQMFVVHFNEQVSFGLPPHLAFTDQEKQLETALSKIAAKGMTALNDAVAAALTHLKKGPQGKQVLTVISDGADNASKRSFPDIIAQARQAEAIIYTIGLFEADDRDKNPGALKQLAKATGGEAFLPKSAQAVLPICEQIAREIRNQYTLTYTPINTKHDGSYRVIEVKAGKVKAAQAGRERLKVRTRAGYFATTKP